MVSYSREFDVRGLDSELDLALRLSALELPPEVTAEQNKLLVEKLLPHLSSEVVKALKVKIDQQAKKQGELKEVMAKLALTPPAPADETNKITEEAKRDREGSGEKQSKSKAQDTAPK